jgi:hypothetical protein
MVHYVHACIDPSWMYMYQGEQKKATNDAFEGGRQCISLILQYTIALYPSFLDTL